MSSKLTENCHSENNGLTQTQSATSPSFHILRVLGEGAFGEVKLVVDGKNPQCAVAMKCMDLNKHKNEKILSAFRKEALLQRKLSSQGHENVIRYIGMRVDDTLNEFQIFLEYADGGELYDQIEPDRGMSSERAQFYFRQLIDGLSFIHSNGVAHRDIKPENLLLTSSDILKISDFGMATIFKHQDKERMLDSTCGTLPYASPEVLNGKYKGEPADIWSCGVVLVALLAGELPWDAPQSECEPFQQWMRGDFTGRNPWNKIDNLALSLIRLILNSDENTRATMEKIRSHPWFSHDFTVPAVGVPSAKRRRVCEGISQPLRNSDENVINVNPVPISFSQPGNITEMLISQLGDTQSQSLGPFARLARRLTRFVVNGNAIEYIPRLIDVCEQLGYETKKRPPNQLLVIDHVHNLSLIVSLLEMGVHGARTTLVDFRRSRGDGLQFKRVFQSIRGRMNDLICTDSQLWLNELNNLSIVDK